MLTLVSVSQTDLGLLAMLTQRSFPYLHCPGVHEREQNSMYLPEN